MGNKESLFSFKRLKSDSSFKTDDLMTLLTLFQILAVILVLIRPADVDYKSKLQFCILMISVVYVSHALLTRLTSGDRYIFMIANMLFTIGALMIFRIRANQGTRQIFWYCIGMVAFFFVYFCLRAYKKWDRLFVFYASLAFILSLGTLVFGTEMNGAKNWIIIGSEERGISFQPSEITKVILVFLIASYYTHKDQIQGVQLFERDISRYLLMGIVYLLIIFMVFQKDLGTAIIFYVILFAAQAVYEDDKKLIWINLALAIVGVFLAVLIFPHVRVRLITWINPWDHIEGMGYQITQSLFAIASGGFFGTGYGLGRPNYVPLAFSDFIFSSVCEEMGIFMGIAVIIFFILLVYRGFKISMAQQNRFFSIVAFLISVTYAVQAILIIGGVMKLIPLTGVTVPFMSAGGTSLVMSFVMLGILQFCSEDLEVKEALDEKRK